MQFSKTFTALFTVVTLACSSVAQADIMLKTDKEINQTNVKDIPSDKSLEKFMQLTKAKETIVASMGNDESIYKSMLDQAFASALKNNTLTASQKAQIQTAMDDFVKTASAKSSSPELVEQLQNVYLETAKATYTQEEVNAMIKFYSSKVGQSIASKGEVATKEFTEAITPLLMQQAKEISQKQLPELLLKIENILKETPTAKPKK